MIFGLLVASHRYNTKSISEAIRHNTKALLGDMFKGFWIALIALSDEVPIAHAEGKLNVHAKGKHTGMIARYSGLHQRL